MDRNSRIGRRERFEILKILQGLGEGVVAVDKGQLRPLRPNTILGALEESIALRHREGRIWPAFLHEFWIGRRVDDPTAKPLTKDEARWIAADVANRPFALANCLSVIFSEKRYPLFGIMLERAIVRSR